MQRTQSTRWKPCSSGTSIDRSPTNRPSEIRWDGFTLGLSLKNDFRRIPGLFRQPVTSKTSKYTKYSFGFPGLI